MAKRLTETTKWVNPDFRKLKDKYKLFYLYILDNCDSSGIIRLDLDLIGYTLNHSFTDQEIAENLCDKITFIAPNKVIIKNFIAFQNGDIFDSKSKIASSIRANLNSHGILERYLRGEFGHTNKAIASI